MKKWERAEIHSISISETEQKISLNLRYDGGYIGDGKFGWFGGSCNPNPNPDNNPNTNPGSDPEPSNPSEPGNTDLLS